MPEDKKKIANPLGHLGRRQHERSPATPGAVATSPLNPTLFNALTRRFGRVRITSEGQPTETTQRVQWVHGKPRREDEFHGGEYYCVDCPYCGDRRARLQFSYLWATPSDDSAGLLLHLVHCFNEGCIDSRERQEKLFEKVFPLRVRARPITPVPAAEASAAMPAKPNRFKLPAGTRLSRLPQDHHALKYLAGRGFDGRELDSRWGVSYCELAPDSSPAIDNRLVIPVYLPAASGESDGRRLVGWQARSLDRRAHGAPKYLSAAGMAKSSLLYGVPRAGQQSEVVVIVEGVTDVWRLGANAVATFGKTMSWRQRQLMLGLFAGRPIVVAYDRDASCEAERVRNELLADRRAHADDGPVVTLRLPAECEDIGDCTRSQAWAAVVAALEQAVGDSTQLAGMVPAVARIHIVDGAAQTPSRLALERIGESLAMAYDETAAGEPAFCIAGQDGVLRRVIRPSRSWEEKLRSQLRIYDDALSARCVELHRGLPAAERFEDVRIMRRLLGDETNRPADESTLLRAERARREWDEGVLTQRIHEEGLDYVYQEIEKPLIAPVAEMMAAGLPVDRRRLERLAARLDGSKQKTGQTLLKSLRELGASIDSKTGRVHGKLDPLGAVTGKFTCSSPNLLGIDARLRQVVAAGPGRRLIHIDFSHFELRVAAQLSQNEPWLAAFSRSDDLHRVTAAEILKIPVADVTDEDRKLGKRINLSVIYGVGSDTLAAWLATSRDQAEAFRQAYLADHSGFAKWSARVRQSASQQGYVQTLWGRRRWFPEAKAERLAVNSLVQATAVDVFKLALIRLHQALPAQASLLLPIHDAVLLEVDEADVQEVIRIARREMTALPEPFTAPLAINVEVGRNWGDMHAVAIPKRSPA